MTKARPIEFMHSAYASEGYQARDLIHYGLDHVNAAENLFRSSPSYFDSAGYLLHIEPSSNAELPFD